jgi:hypothetical protein
MNIPHTEIEPCRFGSDDTEQWSFHSCINETNVDTSCFTENDIAEHISHWEEHESYTFDNEYDLYLLNDGRYALVKNEESGTCSHCGGWNGTVVFSMSLRHMYQFGLTDELRNNMDGIVSHRNFNQSDWNAK